MSKILDFSKKAMERKLDEEMFDALHKENSALIKALEFYRDAWEAKAEGNSFVVGPSEELKKDQGNLAREAIYLRSARFYSYHLRKIHGFGE